MMAEVTSGSNVGTVVVLSDREADHLARVFQDWVDDSLTRGIECEDADVLASYRETVSVLGDLLGAFGAEQATEVFLEDN